MSDALESFETEAIFDIEAEADVRFRRAETTLWRSVADGVLLLPCGAQEPVAVAGAGRALWDVLGSAMTAAEAAASLAARFDVPEGNVLAAIVPVLEDLLEIGALQTELP